MTLGRGLELKLKIPVLESESFESIVIDTILEPFSDFFKNLYWNRYRYLLVEKFSVPILFYYFIYLGIIIIGLLNLFDVSNEYMDL